MSLRNAETRQTIDTQPSYQGSIGLADNTKPAVPLDDEPQTPTTLGTLDGQNISRLSTRVGTNRLREGIAQRKYARYQKSRYEDEDTTDSEVGTGPTTRTTTAGTPGDVQRVDTAESTNAATKAGTLRRGQQKVRGIIFGKKQRARKEGDSEIDVLWENQRGSFLFGRPYYSSQSLLNFDPPAWTNFYNQPSAVDITSATVPDPSWEWAWKTWYVDMSLDCDEQGWQYSFMFQNRFPWHGTHPWFHSFARRRRWIRKRVRKHRHLPDGRVEGGRAMQEAHKLNADYFTIHPPQNPSPDSSYPPSVTNPRSANQSYQPPITEEESESIDNIKVLIQRLKNATVDREKIRLVLQFMDEGGDDLHYLANEMPHTMSMMMYQYSRRQLLVGMLQRVDAQPSSHGEEEGKAKESAPPDIDAQRSSNLRRAVEAADDQVKSFEYWSDVKKVVTRGQSLSAADPAHGWGREWQGIDNSGPG